MSYPVYMVSARPKKETTKVFPLSFVFLGLYYVAARLLTNYVADIADYVTQVIVKSAKVIPVMLIGMFAFKVRIESLSPSCFFLSLLELLLVMYIIYKNSSFNQYWFYFVLFAKIVSLKHTETILSA